MTTDALVATTVDRNLEPDRVTPTWSETRWNGCWNPDAGVGLYLHMGRCRHDLDLWWAQTVAYLPGGRVAVDRSWGRQPDDLGVRTGPFALVNGGDGTWSSQFDGALQLATLDQLARSPQGSGMPSLPVTWAVDAVPASPAWDLYGGRSSEKEVFAGDTHVQQAYTTTGTLTVGGETYPLDGVGYKDHSTGTRGWDGYGSHNFLLAVMPDWTMHAIMLHGPAGEPRGPFGVVHRDGEQLAIEAFEMAVLSDVLEAETVHPVRIRLAGGEELHLTAERLHELPICINDLGDNVNGIDWDAALPVSVLQEAAARLTTADGEVGFSFFERGLRRELLTPPVPAASPNP
jgi:hypothetical protein